MRDTFSTLLANHARKNPKLMLLTGDHGYALFDQFRQHCPDQFLNCGIAEQNMVGVAAGLAKAGYQPVVYGLASFVPIRVLEQIKMDICYEGLPVVFIGDGAGVVYGQLGASHQSCEDVAAIRALPNINIFSPCDKFELEYTFNTMMTLDTPSYFRFGKADLGDVHQQVPNAPLGDLLKVRDAQSDQCIIATGSMVSLAKNLHDEGLNIPVWSAPSLRPFNNQQLLDITKSAKTIFVLEEHSRQGGLGGMVAEIMSENRPAKVVRIGVDNKFSEVCGDYNYLMGYHGLDKASVKNTILSHS